MEFDKSKVFTPFNCDEVKIGSKGYFSDIKGNLIYRVTAENKNFYHTLIGIDNSNEAEYPFETDTDSKYNYFYLVEEPKEKVKRPCTREELLEMLKKQGLPMLRYTGTDYIYTVICSSTNYAHVHSILDRLKTAQYTWQELCDTFTLLDGTILWVEE